MRYLQGEEFLESVARRGPLGLSVNQCGGFVRSSPAAQRPDLQLYFTPLTYATTNTVAGKRQVVNPDPWPGFLISFQPARPSSRGRIDIRARIHTLSGYSAHADRNELREWVRKIGGPVKRAFVVHGETPAREAMAKILKEEGVKDVVLPALGQGFDL